MNAPMHPRAGLRDPFTAFVCDDATADMLRPVAVEHGWSPEKVNKGGLRNAVQSLSVSASPNILFVDLSESADPLNDINALAEVCEPGTIVIAAGTVNDVRLYRDLVASGIHDYLLKPFTVDQLRDTFAHAQVILSGPRGEAQADKPHVMATVVGVRGGVGASTLATSLAWLMGEKARRSTALLDLDVHFGTGALALDLEPGRGLTDAIENPSRIDGLFIERAMVRANERLSVLSAEAPIHQPLVTDGTAFFQLQEEMRNAFESTVLDLPRHMLIQYPHLVHDAHVAVVVAELTLAATRDTIRILAWLKSNAPQTKVVVVANGVPSGGALEISRKDFEQSIERPVDIVFPFDAKVAAQAAKLGKPMAEVASGKLAAPFNTLSGMVLNHASEEGSAPEAAAGGSKSLVGNLKSMLAKPKDKAAEAANCRRSVERGGQELRGEGGYALVAPHHRRLRRAVPRVQCDERPVRVEDTQAPDRAHQGASWRRHCRQRPGAEPQIVRRPGDQVRGLCLDLDPEARADAQAARDDRQGHQPRKICDHLHRHRRAGLLRPDREGCAVHPFAAARHLRRYRCPAFRDRPHDQAPHQQVQRELPRCHRADGARPALGTADHRDARHRRRRDHRSGRGRVPHGRGQDEDRPHDGSS